MEAAWDNLDLAKLSVNSMCGLWANDFQSQYGVVTTTRPGGGGDYVMSRIVEYEPAYEGQEAKFVVDQLYAKKTLSNASMRPIHDQIMHTEATGMAQL